MTRPYGTDAPQPPESAARRRVPVRAWLLGGLVGGLLLITLVGGIRDWWAHRLHDLTGGSKPADYVIGLVIGLLPLLAVVLGALTSRRLSRIRRAWRMFWCGAVGFVVTYLLSPSLTRVVTDSATRHVFNREAPDYLAGVLTGTVLWLVLVVVGVMRARSRWRLARRRPPGVDADARTHRVIDV